MSLKVSRVHGFEYAAGFVFKGHLGECHREWPWPSRDEGETRVARPSREEGELFFILCVAAPCLISFPLRVKCLAS